MIAHAGAEIITAFLDTHAGGAVPTSDDETRAVVAAGHAAGDWRVLHADDLDGPESLRALAPRARWPLSALLSSHAP